MLPATLVAGSGDRPFHQWGHGGLRGAVGGTAIVGAVVGQRLSPLFDARLVGVVAGACLGIARSLRGRERDHVDSVQP